MSLNQSYSEKGMYKVCVFEHEVIFVFTRTVKIIINIELVGVNVISYYSYLIIYHVFIANKESSR